MITSKIPKYVLIQLEIQKGARNKWTVEELRKLFNNYDATRERAELQFSAGKIEATGNSNESIVNSAEALMVITQALGDEAENKTCSTNCRFCLTAVKNHVIRYCEKVYERSGKNLFWSIKNSGEVLNKLKSRGFRATSLSTYDFSTLYTTLPHNLIKEKLINLIEWTFKREGSPYIACNERQAFFISGDTKRYKPWSCQNVCEALIYLLDNIYIRFGSKLYRQIVGIPMGTNCAPLVADLFLFFYERDFMTSLSDVKQAEIIEAFKSTYRYLDDL